MNWDDIDISEVNDIKTLQVIDAIAEDIFNVYRFEVRQQTAELEKEFPGESFERISPFLYRFGFESYSLHGDKFHLKGSDYFRGETDYEWDDLPIGVWIDDREKRNKLIVEFVKAKIDSIREELKGRELRQEAADRLQYEQLKERFEK